MAKHCDWNESAEDVESLIRAAGDYVRASDDLRPRVLEAARLQRCEHWAQSWIRHASVFVALVAFFSFAGRHAADGRNSRPIGIAAAAGFDEFFSPQAVASLRSGDGDWRMLEAFTELRRQQAQVLGFAM